MSQRSAILSLVLLGVACSSDPAPSGHPVQLGELVECAAAEASKAFTYQEISEKRGLSRSEGDPEVDDLALLRVGLAVEDVDGDQDLDVVVAGPGGVPQIFENDGRGYFTERPFVVSEQDAQLLAMSTGFFLEDSNHDGLQDLVFFSTRFIAVSLSREAFEFGPLTEVYSESGEAPGLPISAVQVDWDQDGDLDLFLPGLDPFGLGKIYEVGLLGSMDRLLERRGNRYVLHQELQSAKGAGISMVGLASDRDRDGDLDLFVPSLRGAYGMSPTAFYSNPGSDDSEAIWTEDAEELSANLALSGMGADSLDLNEDGHWDYCISDLNRIQCLLSVGADGYSEGSQSVGLGPLDLGEDQGWSGWSLEAVDLDNDGHSEIAVVAGHPLTDLGDDRNYVEGSDRLFRGTESGFEPVDGGAFSSTSEHYGLVAADLDGDGSPELLVTGVEQDIELHSKRCSLSNWVSVSLAGPPENPTGLGAEVVVETQSGSWRKALHGLRGFAQGPARAHFGLGESERIERLEVRWPDGIVTVSENLPLNRSIRVPHPVRMVGGGDTAETVDSGKETAEPLPKAEMFGSVTRSAALVGDGIGDLVVMVFEESPMQNSSSPPVAWSIGEADFSAEGSRVSYEVDGIPLRDEPYSIIVFLDDDLSGSTVGANTGDLVALEPMMSFPQVTLESPLSYEVDFDLNVVVP